MLFEDVLMTPGAREALMQAALKAEASHCTTVRAEHLLEALLESKVEIIVAAVKKFELKWLEVQQIRFRPGVENKHYPKSKRVKRVVGAFREADSILEEVMYKAAQEPRSLTTHQHGEISVEHLLIGLVTVTTHSVVREYFISRNIDYVALRQFFIRYNDAEELKLKAVA